MNGFEFQLNGETLVALPSGALWWPSQSMLVVSDLHLGKSERQARRGGVMLPPYEVRETLTRLETSIEQQRAQTVLCLGDTFDDLDAMNNLRDDESLWLIRLMAGRRWIWIEGNHDPGPTRFGGSHLAEFTQGGLTFRHIAQDSPAPGEVSGHFHPKVRFAGTSRAAFLFDQTRLILPAFGAFTGGLRATDPVLKGLINTSGFAVMTGATAQPVPITALS